jgi:hypothetical protein
MLASWYENVASDNRSPANPRNLGRSPTLIQDESGSCAYV